MWFIIKCLMKQIDKRLEHMYNTHTKIIIVAYNKFLLYKTTEGGACYDEADYIW